MEKRKLIYLSGAIWELLRFFLIFFFILFIINPEFQLSGTILLAWLGSGHLILMVLFFLVWLDYVKYSQYLPVLTVFQTVNIVPPVLFFLFGSGFNQFIVVGIVLFFDLIFLLILLSFTVHKQKSLPDPNRNLPNWTDTHVEDQ